MESNFRDKFSESLSTGFIDKSIDSEVLYRPKLLVNKNDPKEKVLSTILNELDNCEAFLISVAFVTTSGIAVLMNSFLELEKRGVKGKVLVSQYLNFTQPEALRKLITFNNIEVKISTRGNAHSKGYIFKTKDYYNLVVGSSNLTASALCSNIEWNLKVSGLHSSEIVDSILSEFQRDFEVGTDVNIQFIENYQKVYDKQKLIANNNVIEINDRDSVKIEPNLMQKSALFNLRKIRQEQKDKVLNSSIFHDFFVDTIEYSISTFESKFRLEKFRKGLVLFNKYSRKDVCRLLNWKKDISSTVYGYRPMKR